MMSVTDKGAVLKSAKDVGTALRDAALALFEEQGYERTSTAAIAARAGVTERTFFRYLPDKREVLFGGEQALRDLLVAAGEAAPASSPLSMLRHALGAAVPMIEANRTYGARRQRLIARTPPLHERELTKLDALGDHLATVLVRQGVAALAARLAAKSAVAAFAEAYALWIDDPAITFETCLDRCFDALHPR